MCVVYALFTDSVVIPEPVIWTITPYARWRAESLVVATVLPSPPFITDATTCFHLASRVLDAFRAV